MTGELAPLTILYLDINTEWRGGQRQLLWMGEGLRRNGGRPIFALRTGVPLAERACAAGIEVIAIDPLIAEWGPWTVLRLRRIIKREKVSIVHAQSGHTMALAALALAGHAREDRVRATRHDAAALQSPDALEVRACASAHLVSRAGVDGLLRAGVKPDRVRVVPSGVPISKPAAPASIELLSSFGVPAGAPLAVLVASLSAAKDPATFVRAIEVARREVPALHALIVGDGPLRESLAAEISALGLDGFVHLTGFRIDPEALEAAANVVVLTSKSLEGTPGVLLDALALGKPIVATNVGGVPEVIEDGVSGLSCRLAMPRRSGARSHACCAIRRSQRSSARAHRRAHRCFRSRTR